MTNLGSLSFLYFAISVNEIYSFSKQKLFGSNLQCITYRQQTVRFGIRLFLLPVTDVTCCNPGPSWEFQLRYVLLLHHTKNSFTDNYLFLHQYFIYPYFHILIPYLRLKYHATTFLSTDIFVFLQKTLQIDNWLFENYCSQVSIKIRKRGCLLTQYSAGVKINRYDILL